MYATEAACCRCDAGQNTLCADRKEKQCSWLQYFRIEIRVNDFELFIKLKNKAENPEKKNKISDNQGLKVIINVKKCNFEGEILVQNRMQSSRKPCGPQNRLHGKRIFAPRQDDKMSRGGSRSRFFRKKTLSIQKQPSGHTLSQKREVCNLSESCMLSNNQGF